MLRGVLSCSKFLCFICRSRPTVSTAFGNSAPSDVRDADLPDRDGRLGDIPLLARHARNLRGPRRAGRKVLALRSEGMNCAMRNATYLIR